MKLKLLLKIAATTSAAFGFIASACIFANWVEKPTIIEVTKTEIVYISAPLSETETTAALTQTIKRKYIDTYRYEIAYGDTLFQMGEQKANAYVDIKEVIADIMHLNNLKNSNIYEGDILIMPIYPETVTE